MAIDLGHRLAMARHARHLSQRNVAGKVGISQKHLSQIETHRVSFLSLSGRTVKRLAEYLGVSTDYLLGVGEPDEEEDAA